MSNQSHQNRWLLDTDLDKPHADHPSHFGVVFTNNRAGPGTLVYHSDFSEVVALKQDPQVAI